ncbi:MAG TPA: amidohydrolase, partial [Myxococcota bacterium]
MQKTFTTAASAIVAALLLGACSTPRNPGVDAIFFNARAYTLDDAQPWAEAVAVHGGRIVYVGDDAGALAMAGTETVRHDLAGRMLLPAFIDAHMHLIAGGGYALALSLDTFGSIEDWLQAIGEYARANPDAPALFGYGFLASTFGPEGPTRQRIDAVVADRPVLMMDEGFHGAWANTRALEVLGITRDTPDPVPGFSTYKRDAAGEPTGYLLEGTAEAAMDALDVLSEDTIVEGTAHVIDTLNRYGVTSVYDAGAFSDLASLARVLGRLEASGEMTVRVVGSYLPEGPEDIPGAMEAVTAWSRSLRGEHYHFRVLKIMDDGTVEGRTAAMFEDYQGEPGNRGETVFSEEEMTGLVTDAAARDIDVHIHALGERAVHEALNAIEAARRAHPTSASRYAICHIQVITDEDLPRFAELGVIAQSTPLWASYDVHGRPFVSQDQFERYWRFDSLVKSGARLTFGSDFPASGAGMLGLSPIVQIEIGHTRQEAGEPGAPIQPRESERLDI